MLFAAIAAILADIVFIVGSMRLAEAMRPGEGDIIAFLHDRSIPVDQDFTVTAVLAGTSRNSDCLLDPRVLSRSGGSLVIEATELSPPDSYRVHWAGAHTSGPGSDCGQSAELLLTPQGITVLSIAAMSGK